MRAMTPTRVFFSLVRSTPILPRVAVRQLHLSSPVLAKAKKSKNGSQNTVSVASSNKTSPSGPSSQQSDSTAPSAPITSSTRTSPSEAPELIIPSSSAPPSSESPSPSPSTSNSSSIPPEDVNPLNSAQYQAYRGKQSTGPFTWKAAALFLLTGTGLVIYFRSEKERVDRLRVAEENKSMGTPRIGGPYSLIDHFGNAVTQDTYSGKHTLIYFGFTRCPDICPEELDKMAGIIDIVNENGRNPIMQPLFITCDPARDDPAALKKYLAEFHSDIIGLTGTWDSIKQTCKNFRVYFSTPPNVKPGQDYLVDHSIFFYLMDPENNFVEAFGRNINGEETAKRIMGHIKDWQKASKSNTPKQQQT